MAEPNKDEFAIDPKVEKEADEALSDSEIIGGYMAGGETGERENLVEKWLPGEDEWQGKTIITKREAKAHALAKNLALAFPVVRPMEEFIESSINDLEMLLTSVEGKSRKEGMEVLRAMFGAGLTENEEARNLAYTAIAGAHDGDNE